MVTTTTAYSDARYRVSSGEGLDGVVRVSFNGHYGTGVLLYGGKAILTAAHLFQEATSSSQATVTLQTSAGVATLTAGNLLIHPLYDAAEANNDLALLWLTTSAPITADRYALYRGSDEIGETLTLVGYGTPGTGSAGTESNASQLTKYKAWNQFDMEAATLKTMLGGAMGWTPAEDAILVADFDDGSLAHDALGSLVGIIGAGLGSDEGLIAPGDSGGPAFLDGKLAGVASYTAVLSSGDTQPDVDTTSNSSFGETAFWHRISQYQQWIDQSLRSAYVDAPSSADMVQKTVSEGASGTRLAYFLLQFSGIKASDEDWLSVDYATRDGTALAGSDYIAATGTLILYPGETQAVIPVEILGDALVEADETFYLDVTHPEGGSFPGGVLTLTAMRTILNDDFV
jgi:hypothetical protein